MSDRQFIFSFEEGNGNDRMLLGGKGANLCAMTQIGLNVPPGFVITTEACLAYLPDLKVGDYTIIHVGFGISQLDEEEAQQTLALLREMDMLAGELDAP